MYSFKKAKYLLIKKILIYFFLFFKNSIYINLNNICKNEGKEGKNHNS